MRVTVIPARIRVMHDWDSWPLWNVGTDEPYNLDPEDLPITADLVAALARWSAAWDAQLDRDDPGAMRIPDAVVDSLDRRGHALAQRLADELASKAEIVWRASGSTAEWVVPPSTGCAQRH